MTGGGGYNSLIMKLLMTLLSLVFISSASAEYLYVSLSGSDSEAIITGGRTWAEGTEPSFDGVRVSVYDTSKSSIISYLDLYNESKEKYEGAMSVDMLNAAIGVSFYADLGDYNTSTYRYYLELVNGTSFAGRSVDALEYAKANSFLLQSLSTKSSSSWTPTSFTSTDSVPEPTSAMFLLVGVALLSLKRKCA